MQHATWYFESTREAYTATQVRDEIAHGDCLVIRGTENVTGFLYRAWPVAVTAEHGNLHGLHPSPTPWIVDSDDMTTSFEQAIELARELELPLADYVV